MSILLSFFMYMQVQNTNPLRIGMKNIEPKIICQLMSTISSSLYCILIK